MPHNIQEEQTCLPPQFDESYRDFDGFDVPPIPEWPALPEAITSHNSSQVHCSSSCKKVIYSREATPNADFVIARQHHCKRG